MAAAPEGWRTRCLRLRFWRLLRWATRGRLVERRAQRFGRGAGVGGVADGAHHDDALCACGQHVSDVIEVDAADREPGLGGAPRRRVADVLEPGGRPSRL